LPGRPVPHELHICYTARLRLFRLQRVVAVRADARPAERRRSRLLSEPTQRGMAIHPGSAYLIQGGRVSR
jgi:hypothetical protein